MKQRVFFFTAAFCFLISLGCSEKKTGDSDSTGPKKLRVLATFAPIFSFTKNVAGDAAEVEMLLPPNTGPHDFALAPSDLRKIAGADVIVQNGFGLESWLDRAVQGGLKPGALRIVAAKGIQPLENPPELSTGEAKTSDQKPNEAEETGPNPHVWLDPVLAIKEVENIRDGLMMRDPAHAETYVANANVFMTRLRNLDDEIGRATVGLPNKRMLTFHDSFPYFAARYGFEIVGVVEAFPGREPTPRYIQKLREIIVSKNVRVLFSEPQYSPQLLRSLSEELKRPIVVIDPMETGEPGADFYERVMRENLKSLTDALK
jgi:zinc transport system substrate-binding protein